MTTTREQALEGIARDLLDEIEKGINEVVAFDPRCQHIGWDPGTTILRAKEILGAQGDPQADE